MGIRFASRPAPLKGGGEFIGSASAADLLDSRIRGIEASRQHRGLHRGYIEARIEVSIEASIEASTRDSIEGSRR